MSIGSLDRVFNPRQVAVIGASEKPNSVGNTVVKNLIDAKFKGPIYPVNPKHEKLLGLDAFASISAVPQTVDLAVVCTPARSLPQIVRECGEANVGGLIILSAGFSEVGEEGRLLQEQVVQEAKRFTGLRIVGPNCLGAIVPSIGLNASFAAGMPKPGRVAFVSQSGALCTSILDWALDQQIGFSHFVSVGNMLDVTFADLIDYFGQSPETESILLYVESITDARQFMSAARAFARTKPIIAYKAGRFPQSAAAAQSHTGALAGADDVYDAAFQRAGVERVFEVGDMFECAGLLAHHRAPRGERLAIVTNAGGPGVMACDALLARGGRLAPLAKETIEQLNEALPPFWSHGNPIDILGDAPPDRFQAAVRIVLADPSVDAALVILTPQAMTDPTGAARAVAEVASKSRKPVLSAWMGSASVREGIGVLSAAGIPTYSNAEQAVHAFAHLASYARNLETLYETPREVPMLFDLQLRQRRQLSARLLDTENELLTELEAKRLLAAYDIPVTMPAVAVTAEEAVRRAGKIGYPVVIKIQSPTITHKTDAGGVALNIRGDEEVVAAFERVTRLAREAYPDALIDGVTVQSMFKAEHAMEMILGSIKDPTFGSVILLGTGGVAAEVLRDRVLALPPLNERLARRMIESLRSWPLLRGYRGRPGANIDRLIELLVRFSYLIADHPRIKECDVNPLVITSEGAIALDARIVVDREVPSHPEQPYAHLAIRPYPEHYVRPAVLKDGTHVQLRPIKTEDEPMWHDLLESCSPETIRSRFFSMIKSFTHEMASRYCCIDYDREMAIVPEIQVDGQRKLLGVGRLVADPDHESAEYAVLVADDWQGKGLGLLLTDYCLEIAESWGIRRVTAVTSKENHRMLATFESYGFDQRRDDEEGVVHLAKELDV